MASSRELSACGGVPKQEECSIGLSQKIQASKKCESGKSEENMQMLVFLSSDVSDSKCELYHM